MKSELTSAVNFLSFWRLAPPLRAVLVGGCLFASLGCSGGGSGGSDGASDGTAEVSVGDGDRAVWLTWEVPGHGIDGEPINDLDGFAIYYAKEGDVDKESPRRAVGNINRCKVSGLSSGRLVFRVTALTLGGLESPQSDSASITLE